MAACVEHELTWEADVQKFQINTLVLLELSNLSKLQGCMLTAGLGLCVEIVKINELIWLRLQARSLGGMIDTPKRIRKLYSTISEQLTMLSGRIYKLLDDQFISDGRKSLLLAAKAAVTEYSQLLDQLQLD